MFIFDGRWRVLVETRQVREEELERFLSSNNLLFKGEVEGAALAAHPRGLVLFLVRHQSDWGLLGSDSTYFL